MASHRPRLAGYNTTKPGFYHCTHLLCNCPDGSTFRNCHILTFRLMNWNYSTLQHLMTSLKCPACCWCSIKVQQQWQLAFQLLMIPLLRQERCFKPPSP